VTIREYLTNGYGSSSPATDFRLFCLLHRYNASVHFSTEQIHEATAYRQRLAQFLSLCRVVESSSFVSGLQTAESSSSSRDNHHHHHRPTTQSKQLQQVTDECHAEVRARLEDDFDTPGALRSLARLMKEASTYAALLLAVDTPAHPSQSSSTSASASRHPVEPLQQAREYILKMLEVFGLDRAYLGAANETLSSSLHSQYQQQLVLSSVTVGQTLDSLTQFRSRIRNQCLTELRKIKKLKKEASKCSNSTSSSSTSTPMLFSTKEVLESYESHLQLVLTACDQLRDDELLRLGIKVEDINNELCTWTLLSSTNTNTATTVVKDNK